MLYPTRKSLRASAVILWCALACFATSLTAEEQWHDCIVQADQVVAIGAPVEGIVAETFVSKGDVVRKGAPIAQLESTMEEVALAAAHARLKASSGLEAQQARSDLALLRFNRAQTLINRGATTRENFEQAKAELTIELAELRRLEEERTLLSLDVSRGEALLALRRITAPLSGVVMSRDRNAGEFARRDTPLATVARLDPLRIELFLPAEKFSDLDIGSVARVALSEPQDIEKEAKLVTKDLVFDATSNTFGLLLEMPNPDRAIPAGQRCRINFLIP